MVGLGTETEALARSHFAAFAQVPDPHRPRGRRHPLAAILATAAMPGGARSLDAIGQEGRLPEPAVVKALSVPREQTPPVATLHRVVSRPDVGAFAAVPRTWAQANLGDRAETIAIDDKELTGNHGGALPGVPLVAT
ncbi:MAG: hypothetical protein KatS3mg061_0532 [Dehalococcoidia bacterium]|nr:MAG: hypothetical protein KatS3mg061_0532 [Dehalococcoidia bacterium]